MPRNCNVPQAVNLRAFVAESADEDFFSKVREGLVGLGRETGGR